MNTHTYLQIRGTLIDEMIYHPRPGFETSRAPRRDQNDPAYQLVLRDHGDRPLARVAPQVTTIGCGHEGEAREAVVRGALPLHPEGTACELWRGDIQLHRASIPAQPPRLRTAQHCRQGASAMVLEWTAAEPEGCTYRVIAAMASGRRITLARGLQSLTHKVELDRIPARGRGELVLAADDGTRSAEIEVTALELPARPPSVHIISPAAGERVPFGQPVSVIGSCFSVDGRPARLESAVWSLDGEPFARATALTSLDALEAGPHRLTLTCEEDGERAEASVEWSVDHPGESYFRWKELLAEPLHARGPQLPC